MSKTTRTVTTALAVSAAILAARAATAAGTPDQATLVLRVEDFSGLPQTI